MKHCILLGLALLSLVACKSAPPAPPRALPLRVAIVPLERVITRQPSAEETEDVTDMQLAFDKEAFTRAVAAALDRSVFADAIVLEPPATAPDASKSTGGPEGSGPNANASTLDAPAEPVDWNELALQRGADLILELDLRSQPRVVERNNVNFYLNFPLFLVGGPFCWFLKDHTYSAETSLSARLYDVRKIKRLTTRLGTDASNSSLVVPATARFSQLDLNFNDRTDSVGLYALSVVWPSPLLATDNETLCEAIQEEVMRDLARGLADDLRNSRDNLVRVPTLAPFYLEADTARVEALGNGRHKLTANVVLPKNRTEQPERCLLHVGSSVVEPAIGASRPAVGNEGAIEFPIEAEFVVPAGTEFVGVEILSEGVTTLARSYTFALPPAKP